MQTTEDKSSYRQILKATSLFGGVQIFKILISMVRSKFIAILLGPTGMGIADLLTSTTGLIESITNFGLRTSAISNVAAANSSENKHRISIIVKTLRRLVWITGSLGTIVTIILSPWLSEITFGNRDYTYAFIWISISLLITQISNGQQVVLQGLRKLKHIAQANLIGSSLGLIITVPLYYVMGIKGIVPAIIISSSITLFASWFYSRKIKFENTILTKHEFISESRGMLTMGVMISFTGIYSTLRFYIIRIFISGIGGVAHVGLYSAGLSIINNYAGLIFDAMITDYLPRLSTVSKNEIETKNLINQQATISILFLGPLMALFIVFSKLLLILLYSNKFTDVGLMMQWASMGMLFRASAWSMSWVFMAKGDSKLFFKNEFLAGLMSFVLYMLGYYFFGLTGIGIAFFLMYIYYTFQVYFITKWKYNFEFSKDFINIFLIQQSSLSIVFIIMLVISNPWSYIICSVVILLLSAYSIKELDNKIGFKSMVSGYLKKSK